MTTRPTCKPVEGVTVETIGIRTAEYVRGFCRSPPGFGDRAAGDVEHDDTGDVAAHSDLVATSRQRREESGPHDRAVDVSFPDRRVGAVPFASDGADLELEAGEGLGGVDHRGADVAADVGHHGGGAGGSVCCLDLVEVRHAHATPGEESAVGRPR